MQNYKIAQIGRILGAIIIGLGTLMAAWSAASLDFADGDDKFRAFIQQTLIYLAYGGLVYLAAEIVDRMTAKNA